MRAPAEDRSKYEKLLDDVEEAKPPRHEDDKDSIGSASDLQARVELSEEEEPAKRSNAKLPEEPKFPDVFVGHAEGDRPLLEDDQLSEPKLEEEVRVVLPLPRREVPPEEPVCLTEGAAAIDIFTKAPFRKSRPGRRSLETKVVVGTTLLDYPREVLRTSDYRRLSAHANSEGELPLRGLVADPFGSAPFALPDAAGALWQRNKDTVVSSFAALGEKCGGSVGSVPTRTQSHQDLFGSVPFALDNGGPGEVARGPEVRMESAESSSDNEESGGLRKFKKERKRYQQLRTEEDADLVEGWREAKVKASSGRREKKRNTEKVSNAFSNLSFEDIGSEEDAGSLVSEAHFRASAVGK